MLHVFIHAIDGASAQLPLIDFEFTETQSEVGQIDFSFRSEDFESDILYASVEFIFDGVVVISGIVVDPAELQLSGSIITTKVRALTELGRLTTRRAKKNSHYQNVSIVAIIEDLLATTGDWAIGDTSTMIEPDAKTTVDLRQKETLFAQIAGAIAVVPKVFMRYGGYNSITGKREVDIGYFGEDIESFVVQGENLFDLKIERRTSWPMRIIEAYGDISDETQISLNDALSNPDTLAHAEYATYPISYDALGEVYIVTNTLISNGAEAVKNYRMLRTKNDASPTEAEKQEVGYAVWRRAVRDFQFADANSYAVKAAFPLDNVPILDNKVFVIGQVHELARDVDTGELRSIQRFDQHGLLRVVSRTISAEITSKGLICEITVTDGDYADNYDQQANLYDRLETYNQNDNPAAMMLSELGSATVSVTKLTTDVADCSGGKLFSFPSPTPPSGARRVYANVISASPATGVTWERVQYAALPATPYEICVKVGGTWPAATDITIVVRYTFL